MKASIKISEMTNMRWREKPEETPLEV